MWFLDFVDNPANAAGIDHEARLLINGLESGVTFFSVSSDSASSGRVVPGPIPVAVAGQAEENNFRITVLKF